MNKEVPTTEDIERNKSVLAKYMSYRYRTTIQKDFEKIREVLKELIEKAKNP